ncbi:MAG TPA: PEP-CTERM sorting domain-containing protein [Armatimonadota bacterium]|nr:PEP-CTERM sorting domain-containing protein [Armatimonadota bacterium]
MKVSSLVFIITTVLLVSFASAANAWDTFYDGSQLPTDEGWSLGGNDISECSTDGNALRILDNRTDASAYFRKTVSAKGQPITSEARLMVAGASETDTVQMLVSNLSFSTLLAFTPSQISVQFDWQEQSWLSFPADLSHYRTVRVATDSQGNSYVWLDGNLLTVGTTHVGGQGSMYFGAIGYAPTSESYWDYVAASPEFLPIPEPSSLLALAGGLIGLGGLALRRRRTR